MVKALFIGQVKKKKRKRSTFSWNTTCSSQWKGWDKYSYVFLAPFCHIWRGAVTLSLPNQPHFYFISMLHTPVTPWSSSLGVWDLMPSSCRRGSGSTSFKTKDGLHRYKMEVSSISAKFRSAPPLPIIAFTPHFFVSPIACFLFFKVTESLCFLSSFATWHCDLTWRVRFQAEGDIFSPPSVLLRTSLIKSTNKLVKQSLVANAWN